MNILIMTNTFTPHVGGVTRSIEQFTEQYRQLGHKVLVIAPEFDNIDADEHDVVRIPAIRNFNHTDFSFITPIPYRLKEHLDNFEPDIVHSHHPFLVGSIALRVSHALEIPIVFTHHTKYEDYTHNVSLEGEFVRDFARNIATNYANTCDQVFAPSQSMRNEIIDRGVITRVDVVPTGVQTEFYRVGNGTKMRTELGISQDAFVVGHLGRLTKEKNVAFLAESVLNFLQRRNTLADTYFVVFGEGSASSLIENIFVKAGLRNKLIMAGSRNKTQLPDAYHCMDVFAFASQSETQGMVLTEAMASGVPVVAVDASGVRDVLRDRLNGRLLPKQSVESFADALSWISAADQLKYTELVENALLTADALSLPKTVEMAIGHYERLLHGSVHHRPDDYSDWVKAMHTFEAEWRVVKNIVKAAADAASSNVMQ